MVYDRRRDEGGGATAEKPVTLERTRSTEARDVVGPVTIPFVQVILPAGSSPRGVETNAAGVVSGRRRGEGGWWRTAHDKARYRAARRPEGPFRMVKRNARRANKLLH